MEQLIRTLTLTSAWRPLVLWLGLTLVLAHSFGTPGAAASDTETGAISGIVVVEGVGGAASKPVANVDVRLTFDSKSETRKTGADGRFTFGGLLPGKYTVKVTPPDGMKTKGDGITTIALAKGKTERADFAMIAPATPTPVPTPTPPTPTPKVVAVTPSPQPVLSQGAPRTAPTASPDTAVVSSQPGPMPVLVVPHASPSPATQIHGSQPNVLADNPPPSPVDPPPSPADPMNGLATAIGASASPVVIAIGTPGLLIAAVSPTPEVGPAGTVTPTTGEEVVANTPPRRLITSFQALREAGPGTAAQLRSWATETSLVLGVPFQTQIDGTTFSLVNCGPASLAMVLIAFGLDVDPSSIRDYLNYLVGNYDAEQGTSLYVLARIAREAGLHTFGTSSGLQGWTVEDVREQVRAGHPVITLTKYRFLPGHFGSVTDFDHYIVITGLAGEDFVYNDAAYATEYGYNLLISPEQLERAWAASSVPRHAVAIGYGDSLRPLPIVPSRLTAESLAAVQPNDEVQAVVEAPVLPYRGPAAELLRERMLDRLGARTTLVDGEPFEGLSLVVPPTRLDPAEVAAVQEQPQGTVLLDPAGLRALEPAPAADGQAIAEAPGLAEGVGSARVVSRGRIVYDTESWATPASLTILGVLFVGIGALLTAGGGVNQWRRHPRADSLRLLRRMRLPPRLRR